MWAFKFEEPSADEREARRGDGAATNGWVLMPAWDSGANRDGALEKGCEFTLELPRGGVSGQALPCLYAKAYIEAARLWGPR